ncbi:MAG TPA: bifunctional adenosylcobinamide kinase/adenosylcobinamide-phosphate guanylyltransferase [Sphingobium sp.]
MTHRTLFVTGGARSGKSSHALAQAEASGLSPVFVATAQAGDPEMAARIDRHRDERGPHWTTIECSVAIAALIEAQADPSKILLIDCLTLWTSNLIFGMHDVVEETARLAAAIQSTKGPLILVTNEVGLGIVPDNALAREFRDAAGRVNQSVAAACTEAVMSVSGLLLRLK